MLIIYASTYNLNIEHNKKVINVFRVDYIIANQLMMRDIFYQHVSSNFNNRLIRDAQENIH
jgi:hypothetical protein